MLKTTKEELSRLLTNFYWEIRSAKGENFEPASSLKTIQRGLDRYLQEKSTGFSIIHDEEFSKANKGLDAKVKFLKKSGKVNKLNAAQPLSAEIIEEMWQKKVLGKHNDEALTNVTKSTTNLSLEISKSSSQVPEITSSGQWSD